MASRRCSYFMAACNMAILEQETSTSGKALLYHRERVLSNQAGCTSFLSVFIGKTVYHLN